MRSRHVNVLAFSALALCLVSGQGQAQTPICAKRAIYVDHLKSTLNETQEALKLVSDQAIVELFISPAGTWTMLQTSPKGYSCVVGQGEGLTKRASL